MTTSQTLVSPNSNPAVVSGLDIEVSGTRVFVHQGRCRNGSTVVDVPAAQFDIEPAGSVLVEDEPYVLSSDKPNKWAAGTHLKGCNSRSTVLPGCLVVGSVTVKLPDGTVLEKDRDYLVDDHWAVLGRVQGGRISTDTQVLISYKVGQMRLDGLDISSTGQLVLQKGTPKKNSPLPPAIAKGAVRLANVFMPYHTDELQPWQVFVKGPAFPDPSDAETSDRTQMVSKTIAKLRAGEPVTIVAWGDSVTCGCDASKPELAYPEVFVSHLRERFPAARIKLVNAGIGGSNTDQRLPNLDKEVLSFKPDLVTMEFVNDMGLPPEHLHHNYEAAIARVRAAGAELIIITPHFTMPDWMGHKYSRGGETRPAVATIREIAAAHQCAVADTSKRWVHLEAEGIPYLTLLDSGINHPDDRGHELFALDLLSFFPKQ